VRLRQPKNKEIKMINDIDTSFFLEAIGYDYIIDDDGAIYYGAKVVRELREENDRLRQRNQELHDSLIDREELLVKLYTQWVMRNNNEQ
jgi:hypothetical protein